ncbi:MAG: alpha/beta fold hydrolase, partial [Acidimicrobiales bacterium]
MDLDLHQRFSVGAFDLAWDEWGSGPGAPLVILHGFGGSAQDFAGQIEGLAANRRVLAIELRGHGRSSKSNEVESYTIDHIVDD